MLTPSKDKMADWAWAGLALRVALAATFMYHGFKAFQGVGAGETGIGSFGNMIQNYGIPANMGAVVAGLMFVLGLMLLIGFWTRWAAPLLILGCLYTIMRVHWRYGFVFDEHNAGWEPLLMWVVGLWAVFMMGPGRFSLDEGKSKAAATKA